MAGRSPLLEQRWVWWTLALLVLVVTLTVLILQVRVVAPPWMTKSIKYKPYSPYSGAPQVLSQNPQVLLLPQFLSPAECRHLIALAQPRLKRSTVLSATPTASAINADRTSHTTNLSKGETAVVRAVEQRACMVAQFPLANLEPLQVVRYQPHQFYKPHWDYFVPGKEGTEAALKRGGQRTITLFVYLNNLPPSDPGGATAFPNLQFKVRPQEGTAVMWSNVTPDGKVDPRLLHGGEPPESSTKYGLNIWFRQSAFT